MFHANGWGLPFAAPAVGAKLVLPGRQTDGASLATLMRDEGVTVAAGVQTVWLGVLDHLDATGGDLPDLKRVIIGGSSCPDALIQRMEQRLGVTVQTSWGMTELSPLGTIAPPGAPPAPGPRLGPPAHGPGPEAHRRRRRDPAAAARRGRPPEGQGRQRASTATSRPRRDALDAEGYFDTGDLASIDAAGNLTIAAARRT